MKSSNRNFRSNVWILSLAIFGLCIHLFATNPSARTIDEEALQAVEDRVQSVVERVLPATVGIGSARGSAGGSGVVVSKDGLVLTAAHVVAATGDDIVVYFPSGRRVKAQIVGAHNDADAAMVKILEEGEYPFVELGKSADLKKNDWLIALGHAGGFQSDRTPPVRLGRMLDREDGFITTDCALIGGDSGGPLFNIRGQVVGIHSHIGSSLAANNHVSMKVFHRHWQRMEDGDVWGDRFTRREQPDPDAAVLGIMPLEDGSMDKDARGIALEVLEGGPAETAGVKNGDVLLKIDGKALSSYGIVRKVMKAKEPDDDVSLTVLRDGKEQVITAKVLRRADVMKSVRKRLSEKQKEDPEYSRPTEEELNLLLKAIIDRANAEGETLDLDRDQIRDFGGVRRLMRRLRSMVEPAELARLLGESSDEEDEHLSAIFAGFGDSIDRASLSVVPIFRGLQQVAMGTAIHENGYLITKASELGDEELDAHIDELTTLPIEVVHQFPKYDLALVKVDAKLIPVDWHTMSDPELGSFVAAAGTHELPLAVGVLSVEERNLSGSDKGFLGVALASDVRVTTVLKNSPAAEAGLKRGDQILKLNGKRIANTEGFVEAVKNKRPGDTIRLEFERESGIETAQVKLASRATIPMFDGSGRFPTGGELSKQRGGYPNAFQTDMPIRPEDCGSPVVDLEGRVLGINVARAGRIKSYSIPADTVQELLSDADLK